MHIRALALRQVFTAGGTVFCSDIRAWHKFSRFLNLVDPAFFDDEDFRVKSFSASGDWGSLVVGKDWFAVL